MPLPVGDLPAPRPPTPVAAQPADRHRTCCSATAHTAPARALSATQSTHWTRPAAPWSAARTRDDEPATGSELSMVTCRATAPACRRAERAGAARPGSSQRPGGTPKPTAPSGPARRTVSRIPTVKPVDLMRWLVRLMTPPNGLILDPFLGSGTTAQAARAEGMRCLGIEQNQTYLPLITQRLSRPGSPPPEPPAQTAAGER
ncbi:site-specific DNA-methyltransferase [Fodinicola feengrottensis]|uniref:site-specific DNA-methyltransferase n=1 Tax=Fodinicola feengrottensis TaxID=435914 RepID=UPI0031DBD458